MSSTGKRTGTAWHISSQVTGEVSHSRLPRQKRVNTQHYGADKWASEKTVALSEQRTVVYLAMRHIASIRRYLTEKNTVQLVCSFVLSRLDYCNATLAGLPATHIARLQRIQNNAARPCPPKIKKTACHTTSQTTTLASDSNTHWLQTCSTCFSTLWWFSASVSLFKAGYTSAVPITQIKQWQASQGSTLETEIFRVQVFQLPRTLSFGTLFPLISNSHLPCPPLNPDICSRSPIHHAEINVTYVTGHTAMIKRR